MSFRDLSPSSIYHRQTAIISDSISSILSSFASLKRKSFFVSSKRK